MCSSFFGCKDACEALLACVLQLILTHRLMVPATAHLSCDTEGRVITVQEPVYLVHDATSMLRRDLKPENFLLANQSDRSELKATDFGLSAFFRPGQVFSEILGSAYYIAPEARRRPRAC